MDHLMERFFGLGPVFQFEWLTASRRWQGYAQRSLFVGLLLASLIVVANGSTRPRVATRRGLAELGAQFYVAVVGTQLTLVLLAAPAATAGAICLDKARGTLTHLLVTDLSDAEIVLGKLGSRLVPVLGMLACALPVLSLLTLLGGVDPDALVGAFLVTLGVALLGCALALLFSLWAGKTHEALLGTYAVWGLWLLGPWMIPPLNAETGLNLPTPPRGTDPFHLVFGSSFRPGSVASLDSLLFLAGALVLSILLTGVAIWRLRPVCNRDRARVARPRRLGRWVVQRMPTFSGMVKWIPNLDKAVHWAGRYFPTFSAMVGGIPLSSLDRNPVLWREWHRNRPSRWARLVFLLYFGISGFFSVVVILNGWRNMAPFVNGLQVSIGLLFLSVTAASAMAEERVRGSLDVLMSTPLPTRQIVLGKWLGAFRGTLVLTILPALVILFGGTRDLASRQFHAAIIVGYILAQGAMLTSLGLALATWISRLGRAVGLTVTFYVVMTVGWMFLVMAFMGPSDRGAGLICASAFMGAGGTTAEAFSMGADRFVEGTIVWTLLYAILAGALYILTRVSFNTCLGRVETGLLWEWGDEVVRGRLARAEAEPAEVGHSPHARAALPVHKGP